MEPRYTFTDDEIHERFGWLEELLAEPVNMLSVHPATEPQWRQYRRRCSAAEFMLMHEDDEGTPSWPRRTAFKHRVTRNYIFITRRPVCGADGTVGTGDIRPILTVPRTPEPFLQGWFWPAPDCDESAHYRSEVTP